MAAIPRKTITIIITLISKNISNQHVILPTINREMPHRKRGVINVIGH